MPGAEFYFKDNPAEEAKITEIISSLTLSEKIALISGNESGTGTKSLKTKNIPRIKMADGPMGVHWWTDKSPTYPALIALAATWDKALSEEIGFALGSNAVRRGIHIILAPGVNIYRSPLCGRNFEYWGEDPVLVSQMAKHYIIGIQKTKTAATIKHYALNFQEYNRHNVSSDIDERPLHEVYLRAFKTAVQEAQAGAVMTAYNLVNGIHCSEHKELITDILKNKWGFQGLVMSDWVSLYSTKESLLSGLDLEMPTAEWWTEEKIRPLIEKGEITEAILDEKIRRLLRLAFQFGWMGSKRDKDNTLTDEETSQTALKAAESAVVLLKNEDHLLPLSVNQYKTIAVIGPNSHPAVFSGGGSAYNTPLYEISILNGIKDYLKGTDIKILHAKGLTLLRENTAAENSVFYTEKGEPGLKGEYFNNQTCSGKPDYIRIDPFINFEWGKSKPADEITEDFFSVQWTGRIRIKESGLYRFYAKSTDSRYTIWLDNRVFIDNWKTEDSAPHFADINLEEDKEYTIKIQWSRTRVWAAMKLGYEKQKNAKEEKKEALDAAASADAVIIAAGFNNIIESEGHDRPLELPENQSDFIKEAAARNPNTIVILNAGGGVEMESWIHSVKGVLHAWYLGQETGRALARILFGEVNPSGRLPITIEKKLEDSPSYGSYHNTGSLHVKLKEGLFVGYRHFDKYNIEPLFPFGFGLSYTDFSYSNFSLSKKVMKEDESLEAEVTVKNTGNFDGAEVVQLYISDKTSSLEHPVKELKQFQKIFLKKNETKKCVFTIPADDLKYYDPALHEWTCEEGEFQIHIARSSKDVLFQDTFHLKPRS